MFSTMLSKDQSVNRKFVLRYFLKLMWNSLSAVMSISPLSPYGGFNKNTVLKNEILRAASKQKMSRGASDS